MTNGSLVPFPSTAETPSPRRPAISLKWDSYNTGPDEYLKSIERAREAVSIPIIGSLNGVTRGGWTDYARLIESAGAQALELNMYYLPTDPDVTGEQVEQNYLDLVEEVRSRISIPLCVKIGPYFSSLANFAQKLVEAGADGLTLFNRFLQPDINLEDDADRFSNRPQSPGRVAPAAALDRRPARARPGIFGSDIGNPYRSGTWPKCFCVGPMLQ